MAVALALAAAPPSADAADWTKLQFKAAPAGDLSQAADLTPIAPGDAAWNAPTFAGIGDVRGNTVLRLGDPAGATTDYVEFARQWPEGRDEFGPLRGDLIVDFQRVKPGLPAVIAIHGGLTAGEVCSGIRRESQLLWAGEFTKLGYIVFLPDLKRPTNDRDKGFFGYILNPRGRGDCMADDGWEPGAKRAQLSLQLGVRALKQSLALFAGSHRQYPQVASAFAQASDKVVAFGGSSGGHFATRLALRSEDVSELPGPPGRRADVRVAAAVAFGSIGDCTVHNPVRNFSKFYGLFAFTWPVWQPWKACGPVELDRRDSPVKFLMGASYLPNPPHRYGDRRAFVRWDSPLSGAPGWGRNLGWDGVVDGRWAQRTCEDMRAAEVDCTTEVLPVPELVPHPVFPFFSRDPGAPETAPTHWESTVRDEVDRFFRAATADDAG